MFVALLRVGLLLGALSSSVVVAAAPTERLTLGEGVVVKFGPQAMLEVHADLDAQADAVLTSLTDDSVAGQTSAQPGTATPGDWGGVQLTTDAASAGVLLDGVSIRYADTALRIDGGVYTFNLLDILDSVSGVVITAGAQVQFDGLRLQRNGLGLESSQDAQVSISGSDISGNTAGVSNLTPAVVVDAVGNWWGSANGPTAADNPGGDGDTVSAGVNYGQFQQVTPLLNCSVAMADGQYTVRLPDITVSLACRNAVEFRLAASEDFTGIAFQPMTATAAFHLPPPAGSKQVYVEYRAQTGNSVVVSLPSAINYSPEPASVAFVSPADNAEVVADTYIVVDATSPVGIERVEFFVDNQLIGTLHDAPFEQPWTIDGFAAGDYTLRVVAYPIAGQHAVATRVVRLRPAIGDAAAPVISALRFNGQEITDGMVIHQPGLLQFSVSAPSGIKHAELRLNGVVAWSSASGGDIATWLDFADFANGSYTLEVHATNEYDIESVLSRAIELAVDVPPVPVILAPVDGATVANAGLTVSGSAQPRSQVQLYLDGNALGARFAVGTNGSFAKALTLPSEGQHTLAVDATNSRGTGPASATHTLTYSPSSPQISFVNPKPNALIQQDTELELAIVDATGITEVKFLLDGDVLTTRTSPPWRWTWPIDAVADGAHTLTALVVNAAARTVEAGLDVSVQKIPPPPPPVPTPYIGELISLAPATSYGEQPIVIEGRALERSSAVPVPSALLQVWLEVNGYQRKINVATDANGAFHYAFEPTPNDAGMYRVSVRHPEQADAEWQDQFTIDRVHVSPGSYRLRAARTVLASIPVQIAASAGHGVSGLRFEAPASEQPSGSLPPGIQIIPPEPISLAAGASRNLTIGFKGDSNAAQTGTIILVAYAQASGNVPRARIKVSYELSEPLPALVTIPISLQGGLAQEEQISLTAQLSNQGSLAAEQVSLQLLNGAGSGPAPDWMTLSSPATQNRMEVGASLPIQITASPGASVNDGVYQARLRVAAANASGGDIPVAISVTQSGEGGVRFHVADIYTQTLDENGNPIPGLANARIRIQHETIPSLNAEVNSNAEGIAELSGLAAGHYIWRASAAGHNDANGRVEIQPAITRDENVFLDMDVVSIEWSVTETTVPDQYDVVVEATYQTEVPAPVVLIEPPYINLPELQTGEEFSGELTISNYGLVRADNVVFTPPQDDAYLDYEFMGEVPSSLAARERVTLSYKITAKQPLSAINQLRIAGRKSELSSPVSPIIQASHRTSGGTCASYGGAGFVRYEFYCANGDRREGACAVGYGITWGGGGYCANPGQGSGPGYDTPGGWSYWPSPQSPMNSGPDCTPNCKKCCKGGGAPGGDGGGGSGPGLSGGGQ